MKCYNCGHEQASGRFCDRCGLMVTRVIVDEGGGDQSDDSGEARPEELRCRCGNVQRTGRFCDRCGMMFDFYRAQPDASDLSARCPQCGGVSHSPLCRNCGVRIPDFPGAEE